MEMKLFMVLIGCRPSGRHTEQHDIFFGIGTSMRELIPAFKEFWPEAKGNMHIDGWKSVTQVNGYDVRIVSREEQVPENKVQLFFINLGGYKENEMDEFHYKLLYATSDKAEAIRRSKQTAFFKHTHFEGANAHIDDKFGVDVDDIYEIEEILPQAMKEAYKIVLSEAKEEREDPLHLGYFKLANL